MDVKRIIEQVILDSGLWTNGGANHRFVLSPEVYEVTPAKRRQLEQIGAAVEQCLVGLNRMLAQAYDPRSGGNHTLGAIRKALTAGVPDVYRDIMARNPAEIPLLCKVDLMETVDGYRIAEVDGHNKHGLGYSTLSAAMRRVLAPTAKAFPGVANIIATEMMRLGCERATLIYAHQERFYLPEFMILGSELKKMGLTLAVVDEDLVRTDSDRIKIPGEDDEPKLYVDLPFLFRNAHLNTLLADRYRTGAAHFLFPPKPHLSAKSALAILRNDEMDQGWEDLIRSHIPDDALTTIRLHTPVTYLVQKRKNKQYWQEKCGGRRFVLKESVSSGMKGTNFAEDEKFEKMMALANRSYYRFILQEEVVNLTARYRYYDGDGRELTDEWYRRVTVHFHHGQVADLAVVARRDKKVHGAPDCVQLGAALV